MSLSIWKMAFWVQPVKRVETLPRPSSFPGYDDL